MNTEDETHTVQIKAELFIPVPLADQYDRDVEVIMTCDVIPSERQATRIIQALYPYRGVDGVKVIEQ